MFVDFVLPDLGEGIHEAQVIQVAVREGDTVTEDQVLMEVETDKAAVEIPSPQAGVIERVHVAAGQTLKVGDPLITFGEVAGEAKKEKPAAAHTPVATSAARSPGPAATVAVATVAPTPGRRNGPVPASPAVRRLAREQGIDLKTVRATGPGGRVTREDLESHLQGRSTSSPAPAAEHGARVAETPPAAPVSYEPLLVQGTPGSDNWGPVTRQPLTQIRKTIAAQMTRSYTQIPHVLHAEQVDVTELDGFRKEFRRSARPGSEKLTLTPFIVKALCNALKRHPKFNCAYDTETEELIFKHYYHIGMAVDTPRGLIVPVVRNADTKGTLQLAGEFAELAERVRTGKFALEDLRGGTFTLTNIGALGGTFFTPIINYPEVAILGMGRAGPTPVVRNARIVVRTVMSLCLSFDHRVCDGAEAARFMNDIKDQLERPIRLAL